MARAAALCELANPSIEFEPEPPLKAIDYFPRMVEPGQAELCEHCGSPLDESGLCWSCGGGGFRSGSSPVGTAPLDRSELAKVLGRGVGGKAHGAYSLSMQQAEGMSHLRDEIESMVGQFNASPQTKNSVKQNSERNAVKLSPEIGPTRAAIAAVAQEFLTLGRSMAEVSLFISKVHPRVGRLSSLVLEVYAPNASEVIQVWVNGRQRDFKSYSNGMYRKLRISVYCWDSGAVVELKNASLCEGRYPAKRMEVFGPARFALVLPDKTFQLFKIMEEARLSGALSNNELAVDPVNVVRKYSISKLPFTEKFLRQTGYLNRVNSAYNATLRLKLADGRGRMPRKLAEEALIEACGREVPVYLSDLVVGRYRLKPSEMSSLVVLSELEAWQRLDAAG